MTTFKKNSGWVSFKLPMETAGKLREIAAKTGLKLTTIVVQGIEHQYEEWTLAGFKWVKPGEKIEKEKQ